MTLPDIVHLVCAIAIGAICAIVIYGAYRASKERERRDARQAERDFNERQW